MGAIAQPPLAGVRVVEASSWVSGPYAGLMLADLGAEVIKVEPPTGDPFRRFRRPTTPVSAEFANCNRGKRSVALDLKSPADRQALLDLVAQSDVFMCNWRPDVADRLRLGDAALAAANERLIRVYITGYGAAGPEAGAPAFDSVVQARSALCHAGSPDGTPVLLPGYPVDKTTGILAAQAVLAGLFARERDGSGERIDIAMLDVAAYVDFVELFANRTFVEGQPEEATNVQATSLRPLPASDGWLVLAPVSGAQVGALCRAVGHPEWVDELRAQPTAAESAALLFERLERVLRGRPQAEWLALFDAHDVPAAPCLTIDEHLADPQVAHNEIYELDDWPGMGPVRTVRYPALFARRGPLRAATSPPELGEYDLEGSGGTDV
ncbi:MAG TPA: CoA transferase [Acidimicrobiales bacterium]|nr:CoA transferase [Acidimicrobiales bacterium]